MRPTQFHWLMVALWCVVAEMSLLNSGVRNIAGTLAVIHVVLCIRAAAREWKRARGRKRRAPQGPAHEQAAPGDGAGSAAPGR
jgi:hypothetical protein